MASLGLSLDQIAETFENPAAGQDQLRTLLSELADTIARLEQIRTEVRRALDTGADPDLAPEALTAMEALGRDKHGRELAILVTELHLPDHLSNIFDAIAQSPDEFATLNEAFAHLDPDTSDKETRRLAAQIVEAVTGFLTARPELLTLVPTSTEDMSTEAVMDAMQTDMNRAQAQTLGHVAEGLQAHFRGSANRAPRGS